MSTKNVDAPITPGQCRAARALLDVTQTELGKRAKLGLSTVVDFERSRRSVSLEAVNALTCALESLGIQFLNGSGVGRGVQLRNRREEIVRSSLE